MQISASYLTSQKPNEFGPKDLLYIGQREYGGTCPDDGILLCILIICYHSRVKMQILYTKDFFHAANYCLKRVIGRRIMKLDKGSFPHAQISFWGKKMHVTLFRSFTRHLLLVNTSQAQIDVFPVTGLHYDFPQNH